MRELIRNERRLELCFETSHASGTCAVGRCLWTNSTRLPAECKSLRMPTVHSTYAYRWESRKYEDYMYYGPVPYEETQKWSNLQQNAGWTKVNKE